MNSVRKLAAVFVLLSPMAANADLITADFTGTFRGSSNSLYTEGFQFQFSLTYDDAKDGTGFSEYSDGPNGVGEFGFGDDVLFRTYQLAPGGVYEFESDNVFLSLYLAPTYSGTAVDWRDRSSRVLRGAANHPNQFVQFSDDLDFGFEWFDDGFIVDTLPNGLNVHGWGSANWVFMSESDGLLVEQLSFLITEVKYSTVPEPSTLALFSLGLLGMGLSRHRKCKPSAPMEQR